MGIPKFFRYISERWPLISQQVIDTQIPEYDNLYLDMNSILHVCTHKDADVTFQLTEEQMFRAIFEYIEHLFSKIRPKKLFFMAIDGVAPRAKMNQQRSRRFRTALDAEKAKAKALEEGTILKEDQFDSNAITPGTEFMEKLTTQLNYFVHKKVSEDADWQNIDIVLSGHEVPGEGEHKINECIRINKAQPDYDPNTRHCVYGLDADLIMLGLGSHDPHFSLLREEVVFGPRRAGPKALEEQNFFLLHISLLREYLELEFQDLADEISFPYDFERILDDYILLFFFVGNDFLPNLPQIHINEDSHALFVELYKKVMKISDGYINDRGNINLQRLDLFLAEMEKFEIGIFEEQAIDLAWINKDLPELTQKYKSKRGEKLYLSPQQKELVVKQLRPFVDANLKNKSKSDYDPDNLPEVVFDSLSEECESIVKELSLHLDCRFLKNSSTSCMLIVDYDGLRDDESPEEATNRFIGYAQTLKQYEAAPVKTAEALAQREEIYNQKFEEWKDDYYKKKFGWSTTTDEGKAELKALTENYVEGLQWILHYYYDGVPSWSWYYGYHYAPRVSDVRKGLQANLKFQSGQPFKPFQQLMGVLPERSKKLLPQAYWPLMADPNSPIYDFYPNDFELDKNGKKADWEAVVKIPFVDEKRLLTAMATKESGLTAGENKRNSFGNNLLFKYSPQQDYVYPSSMPGVFQNLEHCHCVVEKFDLPSMDGLDVVIGKKEGSKWGKDMLSGFPSLKTLPYTYDIEAAGVRIFQQDSRNNTLVLSIINAYKSRSPESIARELFDKSIYVNYPYLREAKVIAVSDELFSYTFENGKVNKAPHSDTMAKEWATGSRKIKNDYLKKQGIKSGGIFIVLHVRFLAGMKKGDDGSLVKDFTGATGSFPVQTIVEKVANEDERYKERAAQPIADEFPLESRVILMSDFCYGAEAQVVNHIGNTKMDLLVKKFAPESPAVVLADVGRKIAQTEYTTTKYYPSYQAAKMAGIQSSLLGRICSKCLIQKGDSKIDVGLNLRNEGKREKVLGYTRRTQQGWEYTQDAIALVKNYYKTFTKLVEGIGRHRDKGVPDISALVKGEPAEVNKMLESARRWLKENASRLTSVDIDTQSLSVKSISILENYLVKNAADPEAVLFTPSSLKSTPRQAVLRPDEAFHRLRGQRFDLGDRVVYVQDSGKAAIFSQGTVIGIKAIGVDVRLDVLFDDEFVGGNNFQGRASTNRGLNVAATTVINLTNCQMMYRPKGGNRANKANGQQPNGKANNTRGRANGRQGSPAAAAVPKPKQPSPGVKILQRPRDAAPVASTSGDAPAAAAAAPEPAPAPKTEEELKKQSEALLDSLKSKTSADAKKQVLGNVLNQYSNPQPQGPPQHQQQGPPMHYGGPQGGFAHPPPGFPPQGFPPQGFPPQGHFPPGYYPPQPFYPGQGYPQGPGPQHQPPQQQQRGPQGAPPGAPQGNDDLSAQLMAALQVSDNSQQPTGPANAGRGGRGGRGRGRGGRGRGGRGRGGQGQGGQQGGNTQVPQVTPQP
ncbi:5'-3' exoribonuclease 1 [Yarrowia sp. C11]|nr:5'-3' exoribonuclease 1 [Yarrowia sp. E02]KAG5365128.1 5'-3' exoribonuclease 1 [Yarrowia sp. C11]